MSGPRARLRAGERKNRSGARIFRQNHQPSILLVILLLAASGCGHGKVRDGVFYAPKERYSVALPGEPWHRVSVKGVDLVLAYEDRGASILASTLCGRYAQTGLDILSRNLFLGLGKRRILEQEPADLPGGKAERLKIEARVERSELLAEAYTLKRNPCIYDFVYMSVPDHFEENLPVFRKMMESVRLGTGGGE